jgi:hypothetical protein
VDSWSALSWTWRALRGHSLTFAGLFACGILGLSALTGFRHILSKLGAPWYAWLLVPMIAVAYLARKEAEWLPDLAERKKWARRIFFGSIVVAIVVAKLSPNRPGSAPTQPNATPAGSVQK